MSLLVLALIAFVVAIGAAAIAAIGTARPETIIVLAAAGIPVILLVAAWRPLRLGSIVWSIVFLFDRDASSVIAKSGRLTLLGLIAVIALVIASHVWMSGDWMAQAGLALGAG